MACRRAMEQTERRVSASREVDEEDDTGGRCTGFVTCSESGEPTALDAAARRILKSLKVRSLGRQNSQELILPLVAGSFHLTRIWRKVSNVGEYSTANH